MDNQPADKQDESVSAAEAKTRIECEKIRAEIEVIRRPFYKTASFYVSLVPVLLAVLGLVFTWASGWFDVQRTRINNEKLLVQIETERLQAKAKEQEVRVRSLENDVQGLRAERSGLTNQLSLLTKERDEMRSAKQYFEQEARRLAGSETNAIRLFTELQTAQAERKAALERLERMVWTNSTLNTLVQKQKGQLWQFDKMLLKAADLEIAEKVSAKDYEKYVHEVFSLAMERFKPKANSDHVTNSALSSADYDPPHWHVEPDPTNSTKPTPK